MIEGLYVERGKRWHGRRTESARQADVLALAVATGELLGPLRGRAASVDGPPAWRWRKAVLRLPQGTAKGAAEEYAVQAVLQLGWVKRQELEWGCARPEGLTYAEEGAVAEGVCLGWLVA